MKKDNYPNEQVVCSCLPGSARGADFGTLRRSRTVYPGGLSSWRYYVIPGIFRSDSLYDREIIKLMISLRYIFIKFRTIKTILFLIIVIIFTYF